MKCSKVQERFPKYMDGTLKGSDLSDFEKHLQSCQDCRHELEQLKELDARLKQEVPAYWDSIEPSPDFANRLKRLALEPEKGQGFNFIDSLLGLWQQHRVAMAAGVSICIIIIALAISIPRINLPGGEETPTIAENLPQNESSGGTLQGAPAPAESTENAGIAGKDFAPIKEVTPAPTTIPAPAPSPTTPITPGPPSEPVPETEENQGTMSASSGFLINRYKNDWENDPAIQTALADPDVQKVLESKNIQSIEVLQGVNKEDYTCDGTTVAIALGDATPPETVLYVCIDMENQKVTQMTFLPEN